VMYAACCRGAGVLRVVLTVCDPGSVEYFRRKSEGLTHDEDVIVAKPTLGLFAAIPVRKYGWVFLCACVLT